jgi:type II secretory pathway pseudopilin PulG
MYCSKCGAEISESAQFCEKCGLPTTGKKPAHNKKIIWIVVIASAIFVFIVIGGIMAALLIPNAITAFQKSKHKTTMVDITVISTAMSNYIVDNGTVPTQDGAYDTSSSFYDALSPIYVENLPTTDQWGNNILVYCGTACDGKYGIAGSRMDDFIVVSLGRDGIMEDWEFNENNPESGLFSLRNMDDFNKDIVMWNGSWIRAASR